MKGALDPAWILNPASSSIPARRAGDLSGANLSNTYLDDPDLDGGNLTGVDLRRPNWQAPA